MTDRETITFTWGRRYRAVNLLTLLRRWRCPHRSTRGIAGDWGEATSCDDCGQSWIDWLPILDEDGAELRPAQSTDPGLDPERDS